MLDADENGLITKIPEGSFDAIEAIYSNLTLKPPTDIIDSKNVVFDVEKKRKENILLMNFDMQYSSAGDQYKPVGIEEDDEEEDDLDVNI